ncbi:MAG: hypothetical protein KDA24_04670 [Deltaproteobacteria bacterium]|nr:hypothetical protein [Deltaproteobacteria bacterium]
MRPLSRLLHSLFLPGSIQSRERARWCGVDRFPAGTYNARFLKHRADGDFVRNPEYLWSPGPYWAARAGFDAHFRRLADQLGGSVYSDALLVLHPADHARTRASLLRSWETAAANELADCWLRLVEAEGWGLVMPGRSFHLRVLSDGDPLLGTPLGLEPGEFATGLFPNLHLGPDAHAVPLVEVFVADARGRFASVGTMWSDQLAFSLGAHPLDNARPDELDDSCVYTVHRIPGEDGLHHRIGQSQQGRLVLRTGSASGGDTVQIVDATRDKVLLEVMLVAAKHLAAELPLVGERRDAPNVALPAFAPLPGAPLGTMIPDGLDPATIGAFSIVPEALPDKLYTLVERGALIQRVHFKDVMRGYRVEIDRDGRVGPKVSRPVASVEVLDDRVSVVALERDLSLDGQPLPVGERQPLESTHELAWRGGSVLYRSVRRVKDRKWPYLGCITSPRRTTPLPEGEAYTVGRDGRSCDVPLPDRSVAENIVWKDGQASGTVQIQGGAVERRTFRTDAICVATKAAELDLRGETPGIENLSTTCPVHVLRSDGELVRLRKGARATLRPGDELCIGNALFSLVAPGAEESALHLGVNVRVEAPTKRRRAAVLAETGRRAMAGGRPQPLQTGKTIGALLGVTQIGPAVATDQLPSLHLDPTTAGEGPTMLGPVTDTGTPSWVEGALMDCTPTVVDGRPVPTREERVPFAAADAPVEDVPEIGGFFLHGTPRGLQINTFQGEDPPRETLPPPSRRPARGLPRFGVVPAPQMPALNELPSLQGD